MEPTKQPTLGHGKICYIEIPSLDIRQSAEFYSATFGWHIRSDDNYTGFDDSVTEVSGTWVTNRKPGGADGFCIHIMVTDMISAIDAIVANGGKIVQAPDLAASEVTASFMDPAGNILGLYQQHNLQ